MELQRMPDTGKQIIQKAKELGADLAGITGPEGPVNSGSYLIIALSHPEEKPGLDCWSNIEGGTPGNRILLDICEKMSSWIGEKFDFRTQPLPYQVGSGGIYLKDAAINAGLGCIGKNNLLVTPSFGSRIRLRGVFIEADLTPTGPVQFDPCEHCDAFCRQACPQNAFEKRTYERDSMGNDYFPGRDGRFSRDRCQIQMDKDVAAARADIDGNGTGSTLPMNPIQYCRQCETACPVGNQIDSAF